MGFFNDLLSVDPFLGTVKDASGGEDLNDTLGVQGSSVEQRVFDPGNLSGEFDSTLTVEDDIARAQGKDVGPDAPASPNPGVDGDLTQLDPAWAKANPREAQALLSRQQWNYSKDTFLPIEQRLTEKALGSVEPEAQRAGDITRKQFMQAKETSARDRSRRGFSLSAAQKGAMDRREAIAQSKGVATSENLTRRTLEDRNRALQGNLAGLGKGIATSASEAFGTAANAQTAREQTGEQLNRQAKQSRTGATATGAGMGFQYGGAWGAAIGAGVGYLSS